MNRRQRRVAERRAVGAARPDQPVTTYNLAIAAFQQGRTEEAERLMAAVAKLTPGQAQVQLAHGIILAKLGRSEAALGCFGRILLREPRHLAALAERAAALLNLQRHAEALATLGDVLAIDPAQCVAWYNRALALRGLRRAGEALTALDRALALRPGFAEAMFLRANVLDDLDRPEDARQAYLACAAVMPARADVQNNLGAALMKLDQVSAALACFDRALELAPGFALALINRGRALDKLGRPEEALACQDKALAQHPQASEALLSRSLALSQLRRYEEALASIDRVLALDPHNPTALQEHGAVLASLGRNEQAASSLAAALAITPDHPDRLNNYGLILRGLSRFEEAAESFARVAELRPDYPYVQGNLLTARLNCCDWTGLDEQLAAVQDGLAAGRAVVNPFQLLQVSNSPAALLHSTRLFVADRFKTSGQVWTPPAPRPGSRTRVAYLSADLQRHATAFLMAGMFEAHDRRQFETIAVSFAPDDGSPMRQRLRAAFDRFIDASAMPDGQVIAVLREMEIDIAVDLKGFTKDSRPAIFLERVAPVQVSFLGYPGTWGHACMDYLIADSVLIPPGHDEFYTEAIVRLPDSYQPNDRCRAIADHTPGRAELGLPADGFVFCCFNANYKILPDVFDIWLRLLKRVEGSVLWLLETNPAAAANLRREAAARGVAPERLVFAGLAVPEHHLARQRVADLFLDTLPCNAHTTTSDALWAGLPVLTCAGQTFAGRVAASLLHAAGLGDLVTYSPAEYRSDGGATGDRSRCAGRAQGPAGAHPPDLRVVRHRTFLPPPGGRLRRHARTPSPWRAAGAFRHRAFGDRFLTWQRRG